MNVEELFSEEKGEIPEEWHETFDTLVGKGSSPSGVIAAIHYVTTGKSQKEISEEWDTSTVTIRNLYPAVLALGPQDELTTSKSSGQGMVAGEMADKIAKALDWEEDTHYSITEPTYGNKRGQPRLLKPGWQDLYKRVLDGEL